MANGWQIENFQASGPPSLPGAGAAGRVESERNGAGRGRLGWFETGRGETRRNGTMPEPGKRPGLAGVEWASWTATRRGGTARCETERVVA